MNQVHRLFDHQSNLSISRTEEIIADIKAGKMVILVDEEDRENEGDLVFAADFVTPEAINFMARHARGLICLTLTEERCRQLQLAADGAGEPLLPRHRLHRLDRSGDGGHHGHFGARSRPHRAGGGGSGGEAGGHRPARAYIPDRGRTRRRVGARRPHGSRLRPDRARRPHASRGDLRNHERRRQHGQIARSDRIRETARLENWHHRRPDTFPQPDRVAGRARGRARYRHCARRLSPDRLSRENLGRHPPGAGARGHRRRHAYAGARARAAVRARPAR